MFRKIGPVQLVQGGAQLGLIKNQFYGPGAEEVGGTFAIDLGGGALFSGTSIVGATAAKRR